jgi:hypothetical protein
VSGPRREYSEDHVSRTCGGSIGEAVRIDVSGQRTYTRDYSQYGSRSKLVGEPTGRLAGEGERRYSIE